MIHYQVSLLDNTGCADWEIFTANCALNKTQAGTVLPQLQLQHP